MPQGSTATANMDGDITRRYTPHEPTWLDKLLFSLSFRSKTTRPATPEKDRELIEIVIRLCDKEGLRIPKRIQVSETYIPNAAYSPLTNSITVSSDILNAMPKEQVESVVGHELGHYKHRWRDLAVEFGIIYGAGKLFNAARWHLLKKVPESNLGGKILRNSYAMYYPSMLSFFIPINLYQRFVSEPGADMTAAELTSPKATADALSTLKERSKEVREKQERGEIPKNPILNAIGKLLNPISSHPPIDERIAKMRRLEKEQEKKQATFVARLENEEAATATVSV